MGRVSYWDPGPRLPDSMTYVATIKAGWRIRHTMRNFESFFLFSAIHLISTPGFGRCNADLLKSGEGGGKDVASDWGAL